MNVPSSLRQFPKPEHLETLFYIQRVLNLHVELLPALLQSFEYLQHSLADCELVLAFAETSDSELRIVFCPPYPPPAPQHGQKIVFGALPCGKALEKEEPVVSLSESECVVEVPIKDGSRVRGVISARLTEAAAKKRLQTADKADESEKLESLLLWIAILIEETISLRTAIIETAEEKTEKNPLLSKIQGDALASFRLRSGMDRTLTSSFASFSGIVGNSDPMREVFTLIDHVAKTDATVLVSGETGTGKELVARAIHTRSDRSEGPFIAVNCAALPESIIESELFGHEKGSFTGAIAAQKGRFELANGGTLFLDEIGDLSLYVQIKLLRFLQERSFERVGSDKSIHSDVRIVAATNKDLAGEVQSGHFREDLYFRINVFPVHLPPLRERGADILLLADYFISEFNKENKKNILRISSPAIDLLMIYHWPGNVRELQNCIYRAAILSTDGVIHSYHLPPSLQSASSTGTEPVSTIDSALARLEKEMIVEALKIERGNSAAASRRLGITERRYRLALEKYKIDHKRFRTSM